MTRFSTLYRASALTVCVLGTFLAFGCGGGNGNNSIGGPAPSRGSTTIWTDNAAIGTVRGRSVYRIATVNNPDGSVVTYYGTHDANGLPDSLVLSAHNAVSNPNNPTAGLDPTQLARTFYDAQNHPYKNAGTADLPSVTYTFGSPNQLQASLNDANGTTLVSSTLNGSDGLHYTVTRTKAPVLPASAKSVTRAGIPTVTAIFNAFVGLLTQEVDDTNNTLAAAVKASRTAGGGTDTVTFNGTTYVGGALLVSLFQQGNPTSAQASADLADLLNALPLSSFVHNAVGMTVTTNIEALGTVQNAANPVYGRNFNANNPGLGGTGSVGVTE